MKDYSRDYKGQTVLVTGGAGCVGSNLTKSLVRAEAQVIVLDDLSSAYEWNIPQSTQVSFIKGSILDDEMLKRVFKARPDYVFHLAAHFANQNSVDNPETDLMVNGLGILKVLEYAHIAKVKRFVYSSSGCGVYGLESKMPFEEHDISISLHTPYQVTKLLADEVLSEVVRKEGHRPGDRIKFLLPFLKAYGVSDQLLNDHSKEMLRLVPGADKTMRFVQEIMSPFIVTPSYEHHLVAMFENIGFPVENAFCTKFSLDSVKVDDWEVQTLKELASEIVAMPPIEHVRGQQDKGPEA